jgi:hypothetical protein
MRASTRLPRPQQRFLAHTSMGSACAQTWRHVTCRQLSPHAVLVAAPTPGPTEQPLSWAMHILDSSCLYSSLGHMGQPVWPHAALVSPQSHAAHVQGRCNLPAPLACLHASPARGPPTAHPTGAAAQETQPCGAHAATHPASMHNLGAVGALLMYARQWVCSCNTLHRGQQNRRRAGYGGPSW